MSNGVAVGMLADNGWVATKGGSYVSADVFTSFRCGAQPIAKTLQHNRR